MGTINSNKRIARNLGGEMDKLWSECSAEEKAEVKQIEKERKALKKEYLLGAISHRKYSYRITKLIRRLDEVYQKYGSD